MSLYTWIHRRSDGLPLAASSDVTLGADGDVIKGQAREIVKHLDARAPSRMSIDAGSHVFHYVLEDNTCILTLTDRSYPKQLVYSYLSEVHRVFMEELAREHGEAWRSQIDTAARAYQFLKFDRHLQRLRREYLDPTTKQNTSRLADELAGIQNIMKKNIQEVLDRGDKLDTVSKISSKLVEDSKKFRWGAKRLNLLDAWSKYSPFIIATVVIVLVLWWRFFW